MLQVCYMVLAGCFVTGFLFAAFLGLGMLASVANEVRRLREIQEQRETRQAAEWAQAWDRERAWREGRR
jgi:hypothetical protein